MYLKKKAAKTEQRPIARPIPLSSINCLKKYSEEIIRLKYKVIPIKFSCFLTIILLKMRKPRLKKFRLARFRKLRLKFS